MPKYKVILQRVEYQRGEIEIEAASPEEAEESAKEEHEAIGIETECVNADESFVVTEIKDAM